MTYTDCNCCIQHDLGLETVGQFDISGPFTGAHGMKASVPISEEKVSAGLWKVSEELVKEYIK